MRILIVEDEKDLATTLKKGLVEEGYAVDIAFDGEGGRDLLETEPYDGAIVDIMIPKIDGITLCKEIRAEGIRLPILLLTAKSRTEEKVEGLNAGADDYLTKPFDFSELKARIQALLRRKDSLDTPVFKVDNLSLDPIKHEVIRGNEKLNLTPKEFAVLEFLLRNKDRVVTRTMIIEHVWDYSFESMSNLVDVIIGTLRKKIDSKSKKKLIKTVYGTGFKISDE